MLSRHKWPSFEGIALIIIMVISVFSFVCKVFVNFACSKKAFFAVYEFCRRIHMLKKINLDFFAAFFTADNKISLFSSGNLITGNMVKVTKMDIK